MSEYVALPVGVAVGVPGVVDVGVAVTVAVGVMPVGVAVGVAVGVTPVAVGLGVAVEVDVAVGEGVEAGVATPTPLSFTL